MKDISVLLNLDVSKISERSIAEAEKELSGLTYERVQNASICAA